MIARDTLRDGTHRDVRWWAERVPGAADPLVTMCGDKGVPFDQVEVQGASRAGIHGLIDKELARIEARQARKAA